MNKKSIIAAVIIAVIGVGAVVLSMTKGKKCDDNASATQAVATEAASENAQNKTENENTQTAAPEKKKEDNKEEKKSESGGDNTSEAKVNPTFMYFVDNAAESETANMIASLKSKYPNVTFDIKNVDKDKALLENFQLVDGNIPCLIMLDTSNNICDIKFKCADESQLSAAIDSANK